MLCASIYILSIVYFNLDIINVCIIYLIFKSYKSIKLIIKEEKTTKSFVKIALDLNSLSKI